MERYTNGVYVQSFYFDGIDDKCKSKFPGWQSFLIQIPRQTFGDARELIQIDSDAKRAKNPLNNLHPSIS